MLNTILQAGAGTDTGRQRDHNEDAFLCEPDEGLFAVIDGVGGYAGGEIAAAEARDVIRRRLMNRTGTPEERLREAVANANNKIYWRSRDEPTLQGMACVLTVTLLEEDQLYAAHVGDTRLYKIHGHRIHKLTRDHSFVGMREDSRELSEYEAMHHPRRNEILRDVGSDLHEPDDPHFIDIVTAPFEPECALLLCTDGLTDLVPSRTLLHLVHHYAGDPTAAAEALIQAANEAGGADNITVVVVEGSRFGTAHALESPPDQAASPEEPPTRPIFAPGAPPPQPHAAASPARTSSPGDTPGARPVPEDQGPAPPSPWRYYLYGVGTALALLAATYAAWTLWPPGLAPPNAPAGPVATAVPAGQRGTINSLLDRARPGATVSIPPGLYRETVRLRDGVTLRSAGPGAVRLAPPADPAAGDTVAVRAEGVAGAVLIGFAIGPDTTGAAPDSFAVGILTRNAAVRIDSATVTGTTRAGVDLDAGVDAPLDVALYNSAISNNAGIGVMVRGHDNRLRVVGNTIQANGKAGVVLSQSPRLDLRGNTILDNGGAGIEIRLDTTLARLRGLNTLQDQDLRIMMQDNTPR